MPLCSIEDSQHFFFHCPYFQTPRYDLLNAVSQYQTPTLSILFYVDTTFSNEINRSIFEIVQKFILQTKRFCLSKWKNCNINATSTELKQYFRLNFSDSAPPPSLAPSGPTTSGTASS